MEAIKETYRAYMEHLYDGGKRVALPEPVHNHEHGIGKVYASDLGMCPLAARKKRTQMPKVYEKTSDAQVASMHTMSLGTRYGEMMQEAYIYAGGPEDDIELSVDNGTIRGRIDILWDGVVVEIKSGAPFGRNRLPLPKYNQCLQTIAYGMVLGLTEMAIVMFNRHRVKEDPPFHVYTFKPEDNGYMMLDEDRRPVEEAWNTPLRLNDNATLQEIERHKAYLIGIATSVPHPDYLNDPDGWQCCNSIRKPDTLKTRRGAEARADKDGTFYLEHGDEFMIAGKMIPRCEWWCHDVDPYGQKPTGLDEKGNIIPLWE